MAFGKIGLDRDSFWSMTLREFYNAWMGWIEHQREITDVQYKQQRSLLFSAARWQASATAWSTEQSEQIARHSFHWEDPLPKKQGQTLSLDDKLGRFVRIQALKQERKKERNGTT